MRSNLTSHGVYEIDNRHAPAPNGFTGTVVMKTSKCRHCQTQVILNPHRTRERHYCRACDAYICDRCALARKMSGYEHKSWKQLADEYLEAVVRGRPIPLLHPRAA